MNNRAAVLTGLKKIEMRDIPMPVANAGEVVVRMEYVGICGSDMHLFSEGSIGTQTHATYPFILGHECAGVVTEVGEGVKNLVVGDRVALEPGIPCGKCEFCMTGRYNLCREVQFMSVPPYDGALRRYMSFPAHMAFKLPENVSTLEGALIEPLCVGMFAAQKGEISLGQTVVILGGGCIGLTALLAAKERGAGRIILCDIFDNRLEKALELGATDVVNTRTHDAVEEIGKLTDGRYADVVVEAAGNKVTAALTPWLVARGGVIVGIGNVLEPVEFSFRQMYLREAQLRMIYRYKNLYPVAISAISTGRINVKPIATDIFEFEDSQNAFEQTETKKMNVVKSVIRVQ